jgi:trehalose utilization protein
MNTRISRREALELGVATAGTLALAGRAGAAEAKRRVVIWFDGPGPVEVYPKGMSQAVADALKSLPNWDVVPLSYSDAEKSPSADLLNRTDVLIWWGKFHHDQISEELVAQIVRRVKAGDMGFVVIHSGFNGKPFKSLMGTTCAWKSGAVDDSALKVIVKDAQHPIAKGVKDFVIPKTERLTEPFDVPAPQALVFDGVFTQPNGTTESSRQGLTWQIGKGKVFCLLPGHETYPHFLQPEVQQILRNAVEWAAPPAK